MSAGRFPSMKLPMRKRLTMRSCAGLHAQRPEITEILSIIYPNSQFCEAFVQYCPIAQIGARYSCRFALSDLLVRYVIHLS
jgi:hypothetical protein